MTVVKSLSKIAKLYNVTDIGENDTTDEILDKIAGGIAFGSSNVTVASPTANTDFWGTKTSDMQTSVAVSNGAITGTLKKLTSGQLVTDWGEGYFLSLAFTKNNAKITDIKVGLEKSMGSGLVSLDEDMLGVFKITDKDTQKFVMICTDGEVSFKQSFDLSGLTLQA
jgi:hypothetical protein